MAKSDKPLPSLDELQREIDEARAQAHPEEQEGPSNQGLGQAMRLGVELTAGVLVGGGFGLMLDTWLGSMPLFFIVFFFLGAAAGFRNILRESRKLDTYTDKE